jgi:hypothetical protein
MRHQPASIRWISSAPNESAGRGERVRPTTPTTSAVSVGWTNAGRPATSHRAHICHRGLRRSRGCLALAYNRYRVPIDGSRSGQRGQRASTTSISFNPSAMGSVPHPGIYATAAVVAINMGGALPFSRVPILRNESRGRDRTCLHVRLIPVTKARIHCCQRHRG